MILPHAQFYDSGGEAWAELAPPLPPGGQEDMLQPGYYFLGSRSGSRNTHTTGRSYSDGNLTAAFSIGRSESLKAAGFMAVHKQASTGSSGLESGLVSGSSMGMGSWGLGDRTKSAMRNKAKETKDMKVTFGGQEEKTFGLTWEPQSLA